MPRKIKVHRKDLNEPDEFISTSSRVMAYVKARYQLLVPAAGAVLLLLLIAVVWYYYRAGREQDAGNRLIRRLRSIRRRAGGDGQAFRPEVPRCARAVQRH